MEIRKKSSLFVKAQNAVFGVILVFIFCSISSAEKFFDAEDEKGLEHFSNSLTAWFEVNQQGNPQSDAEMNRILGLLKKVYSEAEKIPDKTLEKIDKELKIKFRDKLQPGAREFETGLRSYWESTKSGKSASPEAMSKMKNGQNKLADFQAFYNSNIERIVNMLRAKGIEIFG